MYFCLIFGFVGLLREEMLLFMQHMDMMRPSASFCTSTVNCFPGLSQCGQNPVARRRQQARTAHTHLRPSPTQVDWHPEARAWLVFRLQCPGVSCRGAFTHYCWYSAARCSDGKFPDCKSLQSFSYMVKFPGRGSHLLDARLPWLFWRNQQNAKCC